MALKELASILLHPRRRWLIALAIGSFVAAAGCGYHRESLRPVYTTPGAVSAPCTNGGAAVSEPAAGAVSGPLPSEPAIGEPSGATESTVPALEPPAGSSRSSQRGGATESTVPALEPPAGSSRSSQRGGAAEPAPKASVGGEPDLDMIPSPATGSPSSRVPPAPSPAGRRPALQGPSSSPSPSTWNTPDGVRTASTTGRVRRAGIPDRLRPYLGANEGNELFYPNKADRPWKYIVLHHSANPTGSYDQIDSEHRKVLGYDGCGYHFVIGNGTGSGDGQIEVAQRWVNQKPGVHCRNAKNTEIDEYGIGICLVGDLDKVPPTPGQVAAAQALIAYLSTRYGIARSRVETHAHLAATPTVCPGKYFPAEAFGATTREAAAVPGRPVPTSWRVVRRARSTTY